MLGNALSSEVDHDHANKLGRFKKHFDQWRVFYICVMFLIVTDVPSFMGEGPMLRMLELGACREYYTTHDPDMIDNNGNIAERLCKLPEIQSRIAMVRGLLAFLEAVPGLLLAVPYGIIADVYGRGLVVGLCLVGFLIRDIWIFVCLYFYTVFPLNAVYLAPMAAIIGGGSTVTGPMLFAIMTASTPRESRFFTPVHHSHRFSTDLKAQSTCFFYDAGLSAHTRVHIATARIASNEHYWSVLCLACWYSSGAFRFPLSILHTTQRNACYCGM